MISGKITLTMNPMIASASLATVAELGRVARASPGLDLLLLFGSRARSDAQTGSDWDLGYLAQPQFDPPALLAAIVEAIRSDRVDLVDLARAGGLLRFRAARDGQAVYEVRPRLAEQFCLEAAQFWCDASAVIERGYDDVLADLKP